MITRFDVGEKVLIEGIVNVISITKDEPLYEVCVKGCKFVLKDSELYRNVEERDQ